MLTLFSLLLNQLAVDSIPAIPASGRFQLTWYRYVLISMCTAPLALRRSRPVLGLVLISAAFLYLSFENPSVELTLALLGVWLAFHAVGSNGDRGRDLSRALVGVSLVASTVYALFDAGVSAQKNPLRAVVLTMTTTLALITAAWMLGDFSRERRETTELLGQRAAELERSQAENSRRAVLDERVRIARELHDVVAHHVSVMGVQAGAARRVMSKDPQQASEALSAIESSSRQAVGEMQRLIGFLRQDGDVDALAPQPGLDQLERLIDEATTQQLAITLSRVGEVAELPSAVDLSAYRIVQEALTNVRKHARATRASVSVNYGADALEIEVLDNGITRPVSASASPDVRGAATNGLRGMQERAALLGGTVRAGAVPGGGFRVSAHLPLHAASHAAGRAPVFGPSTMPQTL